jgi:glycine cleavage system H lipoate-binding protein
MSHKNAIQSNVQHGTPGAELRFLQDAWIQPKSDELALVGALLAPDESAHMEIVHRPRTGERLERGLPMLTLHHSSGRVRTVVSPVSGEVAELNSPVWQPWRPAQDEPIADSWIARVRCFNLAQDLRMAKPREVVVASLDPTRGLTLAEGLRSLGCTVTTVCHPEEAESSFGKTTRVLFLDAIAAGEDGPRVLQYLKRVYPQVRSIVVGPANDGVLENACRSAGVAYYAIEPVTMEEVMNILASVFKQETHVETEDRNWNSALPKWMSRIRITNHDGHVVGLRASGQVLDRSKGLGYCIVRKLMEEGFPVSVTHGTSSPDAAAMLKEFSGTDRLWLVELEDSGRAPGTLSRTTRPMPGAGGFKPGFLLPALVIQPVMTGPDPLDLEPAILDALASHIVDALKES